MQKRELAGNERYLADLSEWIKREYGLAATSITPANRGYYGETWRMDTINGSFFLKLDYAPQHQKTYRNSLEVVDYLCANGIDFIGGVVKTKAGGLFSTFHSAVLAVFNWIDGKNMETDETKTPEYEMLSKVYAVSRPGFAIPRAVFTDDMAVEFYAKWEQMKTQNENEESRAVHALFERNEEALSHYAARLKHFADRCRRDTSHFYFTHGDAGGNLLVGADSYSIADWDEVMYSPPERDAWVMCCREWAVELFNKTLRENGVAYELRPERLAFYCYHMYFHYLCAFLNGFLKRGMLQEIEDYFSGWIVERMEYADTML